MKTIICTLSLFALSTFAQDATLERSKTATEATRAEQRKLEAEARAKAAVEGKPVVYTGFFVDVARAEKKTQLLSLRQSRDPANDYRNLYLDERTARPKGFVLFRVGF